MIRTRGSRILAAACTLLAGAAAVVSCGDDAKQSAPVAVAANDFGAVGLAIKLSNGADVSSVSYKISGNGITPITGTIAVNDPGAKVTVFVSGLPAAKGYTVEMNAASADGKTTCAGSATFEVVANNSSKVDVLLECRTAGGGTGSVIISGSFNACPVITTLTAAPIAVAVGGSIALGASASDADGNMLTYAWKGDNFSATGASASYKCTTGGDAKLTLTVSDGNCTDSTDVTVSCVTIACGDGKVDPSQGEECDPPAAGTCDAVCHVIPVCGNGKVEKGEDCDPADGVLCDSACHKIAVVCGNGIKQPGEDCDAGPNGSATCSKTCKTIVPVVCGDGVVGAGEECDDGPNGSATCGKDCKKIIPIVCGNGKVEAGEECDDGPNGSATCGKDCKKIVPVCGNGKVEAGEECDDGAAGSATCGKDCKKVVVVNNQCGTCEADHVTSGDCDANIGCDHAGSAADIALCKALYDCMKTSGCWKNDPLDCLCGTAAGTACAGAGANGACKAQIQAATKTTDPVSNGTLFYDMSVPAGFATQQIACDHDNCLAVCQ